jgi:glucokinase
MRLPYRQSLPGAVGAVDIGGTKIAVGLVSLAGAVLASRVIPTAAEKGPLVAIENIARMLEEVAAETGIHPHGIGIGSTGPVDPYSGEVGVVEFLPGWEGFNLIGGLARRTGLPVELENDADAAALGEAAWGAGRGSQRFIYLTISTGIGGGIVIDGQLYRGVTGTHPEVGHQIIQTDGPLCGCGARGCWESLASGPAMARLYGEPGLDARAICAAAENGNRRALEAIAQEGFYLGVGIANLITVLAPQVIALGGGVMRSRHLFWSQLLETVRKSCMYVPLEQVRIVPAELGSDAGLVGAAQVWLQSHRGQ